MYSNFASKEDLFFAVYERRVEQALSEVVPGLRQAGAEQAFNWAATAAIERRDRDDGWLAVFFEFWAHVLRHPELRERFAAIHARFLEPLADAVRQLAEDRGLALPADVTAAQVVLAWNAMEIGLGLERLTQPQALDAVVARRMGWLLLGWVGQLRRDQLCLDRYRVLLTSGSSGRPGLFVYDPAGWRSLGAQLLRSSRRAGLAPSLPRQRLAWLGGAAPSHISRQGAATLSIGLHRVLVLPVTLPLPELVEALNRFQPPYLNVYPSVAMRLAEEQQAGRLRLSPRILVTAAELRTPAMTQRLVDAFGVRPFDVYGSTEGLFGSECQHHQGIHLFEDTTLVENLDGDGQPVPAGQPGARLLVTNLYNLVQPLLRLEGTDLVTLDPDPCPCGRTLVRVRAIHGRSDDVLSLPAHDGGRVSVHPLLTRDPQVREFQVLQHGPTLHLRIVPRPAATAGTDGLETRLGQAVTQQLLRLGVQDPQVRVERRQQLPRSPGGKLKLVIADPITRPAHTNAR